jgi:putative nucleotidyltransferase with HDIG domain
MHHELDEPPSLPLDVTTVIDHLAVLREEVITLAADRARWESDARQQQERAEQAHQSADAAEQARASAEARARTLEGERQALAGQLQHTEAAAEQARAEAENAANRVVMVEQRSSRLIRETCHLHALQLAELMAPDTLYDNILEVSVELSGAEKGVYLSPAHPFDILATEQFAEARPESGLLGALAARVAERQDLIVLNDHDEIASLADDPLANVVRNLVGYPIVVRERLTGVVVVANKRTGPFTEEDTQLLLGIGNHAAVALENRRLRRDLESTYAGTVALLCDVIEAKDPYTHGHSEEVAALAMATARELGLGPEEQQAAFQAGLLHDVGKVAISDGILLKPGALLPAERVVIEAHSGVGADLVRRVPALSDLAISVHHHHERWDGTGYPDGLTGEAIPTLARIVGAADAYQAMRSIRPYRPPLDEARARVELREGAGTQFDPRVVDAMLRVLDAAETAAAAERDPRARAAS